LCCRYIKNNVGTFQHNGKQYKITSMGLRKIFFTSWTFFQTRSLQGQYAELMTSAITQAAGNSPETVQQYYSFSSQPLELAMLLISHWRDFTMQNPMPQPMLALQIDMNNDEEPAFGPLPTDSEGPSTAAAEQLMQGPESEQSFEESGSEAWADSGSDGSYSGGNNEMEYESTEDEEELDMEVAGTDEDDL
jgi:hypothetical protein